jgi:hypothetical protein
MSWPWFSRAPGGGVEVSLDADSVRLLTGIFGEILALLEDASSAPADPLAAQLGIGVATSPPEDPALARLLPDAYPDDAEAAAEFRRYTELGLRERKRAAARTVLASLAAPMPVRLQPDELLAWLTAINDARLALGVRLDIEEDWTEQVAALAEDDPAAYSYAVYEYLTEMQERLVQAAGDPPPSPRAART